MTPDLEPILLSRAAQKAVVADAQEAFWQDVDEPAADKFFDAELEDLGGFGA